MMTPITDKAADTMRAGPKLRLPSSMSTLARGSLALVLSLWMALTPLAVSITPAAAQGRVSFVRDAEIEYVLGTYTRDLLQAAGLGSSNIQVYLIPDRRFNAFVADGRRIFLNLGVVMQADVPNEVIGVLAHEIGHIAGGHLARMRGELARAQAIMILQAILGGAAIAAGAGQAGAGVIAGGSSVAQRSFLRYRRAEEASADQAAVAYLTATKQSPRGMLRSFEKLADQSMFSDRYADPYARSHPMPRDRVEALRAVASRSPYFDVKDPPVRQRAFDLIRAKTFAYLEHPTTAKRRYPNMNASEAALYANTIIQMRTSDYRSATRNIDRLIQGDPNNPFFHELKGEILTNAGRPRDAVPSLRKAVSLAPNIPMLRVALGRAYVVSNDPDLLDDAVRELTRVTNQQRDHAGAQTFLARAYGALGQTAKANLASAESALARGDFRLARQFAARAKQGFKTGEPGWLRAEDILQFRGGR
jgi:predicted Zn-dependent protease